MLGRSLVRLIVVIALVSIPALALGYETLGGIRLYTKLETPRTVASHPAYPLKPGGDSWLFQSSTRRAQHSAFVSFSQQNLPRYEGQAIDCADVALDNLVSFAQQAGLRLTMKVYRNGWRYVDSAQFQSVDQLKQWTKQYLGAHNVTDNCELIRPLAQLSTPQAWDDSVKAGDLLMWSYNKPARTDCTKAGCPTTVGHTQPVMEVHRGATLQDTRLKVMNGDIQLSTGTPLPARSSNEYVCSIKPVTSGCSLSNYPDLAGQLFHVLQKYDWTRPIGVNDAAQACQGPVRWCIFR